MAIAELFALNAKAKIRLFFQSISFLQVFRNFKDRKLVRKGWWLNASRVSNIISLETKRLYHFAQFSVFVSIFVLIKQFWKIKKIEKFI